MNTSIKKHKVLKIFEGDRQTKLDSLAVEEPLEISISTPQIISKNISITMRTPSNDKDLALGFLFTEGIIIESKQIEGYREEENKIVIQLNESIPLDLSKIERHFYTSSSCGVCGKASIDSVRTECKIQTSNPKWSVSHSTLHLLPQKLRDAQSVFESTGGIHAAALFDLNGELIHLREDVGRHNALDKLIGVAFMENILPVENHLLLLSGRASFELIQKALVAVL